MNPMRSPLALPVSAAIGLATWLSAPQASATYSVVATEARSQRVGGAGTSCVGAFDVGVILGIAPGFGAVHAQALVSTVGRDEAVSLLAQAIEPQAVLDAITAPGFDPAASQRQYGIVSLTGLAAGFTGTNNEAFAADRQGTVESFSYSIQGNILTGVAVLDGTEAGFVRGGGCDMPERLMLALEAGAADGQGDSRCTPSGIPADSAFIRVVDESGAVVVDLSVTDTAPQDPMVPLRSAFDAWRADHPCPVAPPMGTSSGGEGSGTAAGETSGTSTSAGPGTSSSGSGASTPTTTTATSSSTTSSTEPTSSEGRVPEASEEDASGCGCRSGGAPGWLWIGLVGLWIRRRLRPRRLGTVANRGTRTPTPSGTGT